MKNYLILAITWLLGICVIGSCSKECEHAPILSTEPTNATKTSKSTVTTANKTFIYKEQKYTILLDAQGDYIPTEESDALQQAIAQAPDLTAFVFLGKLGNHTYLFDTELEGYKYSENHIDQRSGRLLQIVHATNLLRDRLIEQYGLPPLDYNDPAIKAAAALGIAEIYTTYNIVGTPPKDVAAFMGTLGNTTAKTTNNNSWRLWEHPIQNGEVFDIETEPNVWSWVHGEWDCNITYAAMNLDWNYRQNNRSWNDKISSFCFNYQPGADAMAFGVYKDAAFASGLCNKFVITMTASQWYSGQVVHCHNDLTNLYFGSFFCKTLDDDISSLRMQVVWRGCPIDFSDF
jgi:hypothetical protein